MESEYYFHWCFSFLFKGVISRRDPSCTLDWSIAYDFPELAPLKYS